MKIVFMRHCETDWNVAGKMQGHSDIPLNDHGREQARTMAGQLAAYDISLIYSSPLKRALETAELVSPVIGVPVRTDLRLRECGFGFLEGMTFKEAVEHYPNPHLHPYHTNFYKDEKEPYDFTPYGGESKAHVLKRQLDLLGDLKGKHDQETLLLIGHGTSLNTLLLSLGQHPDFKREQLRFAEI